MAYRFFFFACFQALYLQNAYAQAVYPACQSQVTLTETCVQNPVCQSTAVQPSVVTQANPVFAQPTVAPYELEYVGSYAVPPVIIQDDSIANNLANALQLLIVSNLLGNTLPFNNLGAFPQPGYLAQPGLLPTLPLAGPALQVAPLGLQGLVGGCGCGGLNYIF